MNSDFSTFLPLIVDLALMIIISLTVEALLKRQKPWRIPAIIVYATTALWYFSEIIYSPDKFLSVDLSVIRISYLQIIIFLVCFRLFLPIITRRFIGHFKVINPRLPTLNAESLLKILGVIWLILFLYGVSRLNWDFRQALFPLTARTGARLFGRAGGAGAGVTGFIISTAGYLYVLICGFFGISFYFQNRFLYKIFNLMIILMSWPSFLLGGTRNLFLAVSMPGFLTYLLVSRQKWWLKLLISIISYFFVDYAFSVVIAFRNTGYVDFFQNLLSAGELQPVNSRHLGLDMLEELFFINQFYDQGLVNLQYGKDYLFDALNFIPRAIWPDKPLLGLEYNLLRGKGGSLSDIGVHATIAAGFIGRGVLNFGPWVGPVFPAFLLSVWAALLSRLWHQRYSILRLGLFLIGLGITPNLGRDITLLVLWPFVFGYVLVLCIEHQQRKALKRNVDFFGAS
jgi:hypothetical protein